MKRFFDFSSSQIKLIIFLAVLLVVLSVWKFLRGYSEVDERSLKFTIQVGDNDTRYLPPFRIDLNKSPADSLELLPGIGPVLASRIINYRDSVGFKEPADILKVRGIGGNTYENLKDYLEVNSW